MPRRPGHRAGADVPTLVLPGAVGGALRGVLFCIQSELAFGPQCPSAAAVRRRGRDPVSGTAPTPVPTWSRLSCTARSAPAWQCSSAGRDRSAAGTRPDQRPVRGHRRRHPGSGDPDPAPPCPGGEPGVWRRGRPGHGRRPRRHRHRAARGGSRDLARSRCRRGRRLTVGARVGAGGDAAAARRTPPGPRGRPTATERPAGRSGGRGGSGRGGSGRAGAGRGGPGRS